MLAPRRGERRAVVAGSAAQDRAELVTDLLASLDDAPTGDPAVVCKVWAAELHRRARQAADGTTTTTEWPEVRGSVRQRLTSG